MRKKMGMLSQMLEELLHPSAWTWKHYATILGFLLALNLFGPKGIVHWVIVEQEALRLEAQRSELKSEYAALKEELKRFGSSDIAKIRAIHEDLGYLTHDEISFEFTDAITDESPAAPRVR